MRKRNALLLSLLILLAGAQLKPACAQSKFVEETGAQLIPVQNTEESKKASTVSFPGAAPGLNQGASVRAAAPIPVPQAKLPELPKARRESLMVTRMNGEVHLKHLQGPRIEPSRALSIETGRGQSWAEFKLQNLTGRVWSDSEVLVFPDTGVCYLKKGALIVHVCRESAEQSRYSVLAGDYVCRVNGSTLRVQCTEKTASFQVLSGEIIVYNRKSGELYKAGNVSRPLN